MSSYDVFDSHQSSTVGGNNPLAASRPQQNMSNQYAQQQAWIAQQQRAAGVAL